MRFMNGKGMRGIKPDNALQIKYNCQTTQYNIHKQLFAELNYISLPTLHF